MKKTETCPKCSGKTIGPYNQDMDTGLEIDIGGEFTDHKISTQAYLCLQCGYVENYLSTRDLIKIKEYLRLKGVLE